MQAWDAQNALAENPNAEESYNDAKDDKLSELNDHVESTPPNGPEYGKGTSQKPLYRDGELKARLVDVKIDPITGLVQPTRGVSLNENTVAVERFGGAREVVSVPDELQIIQRGKPGHYEIVPRQPMMLERYQQLLDVKLK